jgi:hypothetical protein
LSLSRKNVFRTFLGEDSGFAFAWDMELAGNLRTLRRSFERLSLKAAIPQAEIISG